MCATGQGDSDNSAGPDAPVTQALPVQKEVQQPTHASFFDRPIWRNLFMPLVTNTIPIVCATFAIALIIRSAEYENRIRSVGVAARVEIIKSDYVLLREMAMKLRRLHRETDEVLVARAAGMEASISPDVLGAFAAFDDAVYFVGVLDDHSVTSSGREKFRKSIDDARAFTRTLHDCLAPALISAELRAVCAGALKKYRSEVEPSLALHFADNMLLALRRQLPQ
jgi:hypothetical protein